MFLKLEIEELFGDGAYQDENYLVIPVQGKAEKILALLLSQSLKNFKGIVVDENGEHIEGLVYDNQEAYALSVDLWRVLRREGKIIHQFIIYQRSEEN